MEPRNEKEEGERLEEAMGGLEESTKEKAAEMSRKEKRKAMKKMKRKQVRKEIASKEREEAEAKLNDPVEQGKLKAIEEEEERKREKELKEFEESERAWREAMEIKRKKEEEEERRWKELRKLEASRDDECGEDENGEYEYIEEGPPEIIFQGNEIILRKNKVRVPKKSVAQMDVNEIADRPTSNPLPPGSEALSKYQNVSSAQQILDSVAQEVPNFGTEQDKAHCPFHLKTGACRFGTRCSRVHFYPDKSCTILMKNMYNIPGITWEQDEGLEYTDEEAEHCYEEFYEDVHTEFQKYGELINFKVNCEFVNISRWKVAICGEFMKSRLKTCSRGSACNFIHCFRNPGGDYEWADYDKPPPRFWIHKMAALFGYSDEYLKHMEREYLGSDHPTDSQRQPLRRSRSRDHDRESVGSRPSYRSRKNHGDSWDSSRGHKLSRHEENRHGGDGSPRYAKETSRHESKWSEHSPGHRVMRKRIHERYSGDDSGDEYGRGETGHKRKSTRRHGRRGSVDDEEDTKTHWSRSDRRSRKEDDREGSSADQEESHGHDRVQAVGEKSQRERSSSRYSHEEDTSESRHRAHKRWDNGDSKRSVGTSPGDKDREKSKQRGRYKTGDTDSDRSRKGKQGRESQEDNRNGKREVVSDEESADREVTHKEKSRSHRKRRRSQHSHEQQTLKESEEGETERWRPM